MSNAAEGQVRVYRRGEKKFDAADRVLVGARAVVGACWPYLAGMCYRLSPRWVVGDPTMTVGVDAHWRLYINPDWIAAQPASKVALILVGHELEHIRGSHHARLTHLRGKTVTTPDGRVVEVSNVAHDLAINSGLSNYVTSGMKCQAAGRAGATLINLTLPDDGMYPENFRDVKNRPYPRGLVSEGYAELLLANDCTPKGGGGGGKSGQGGQGGQGGKPNGGTTPACGKPMAGRCCSGGGKPEPWEERSDPDPQDYESGTTPIEQDIIARQTAELIKQQAQKDIGSVPGHLRQWAEIYLTPSKVPWRRLLAKAIREAVNKQRGRVNRTYQRMSRRDAVGGIIMPGWYHPEPRFVVVLDTSGSMGVKDYELTMGHIAGILKSVGCHKVPVLACDAAVAEIQFVSDVSEVKIIGGGGTDMRVAIDQAVDLNYPLAIVLTDGYTPWPAEKPRGTEVIVCLTQGSERSKVPDWMTTIVQED